MSTAIRDMDYGEGGPAYRIHFEVTSPGCPAKTYGPPEDCFPAEAPEWEITGIDGEDWDDGRKAYDWVPIEKLRYAKYEVDAIYAWDESLDLSDEAVEAVMADREAALEFQAEARADALAEAWQERNGR